MTQVITVTIEYFGPAKDFTSNKSSDTFTFTKQTSAHTTQISLKTVIDKLNELYTSDFIDYIIRNCGIALDDEYLTLDRDSNFDEVGKEIILHDKSELVIVPPVSSG